MANILVLVAAAVVLTCIPSCLSEKTLTIPVQEQERPKPTHCRGGRGACALIQLEQTYYVGVIEVGSNRQKILVMFDTGSSVLWVSSSLICKKNSQYCRSHKTYDHSTSKSYVADGRNVSIGYVDGEVKGFYSTDNIVVGGLPVTGQKFVEVDWIGVQNDQSAGVFGLGFMLNGAPDPPFIKMARTKVIANAVFAFYLDRNNKRSQLTLGGADTRHFMPPMVFVPVIPGVHWQISIDTILVNNAVISKHQVAIVDSGCTHIAGPSSIIDLLIKNVGTRDSQGMVYPDCRKIASFPNITFVINRVPFTLKPHDYILQKRRCESAFTVAEGVSQLILGNAWMTVFYTLFDVDGKRIGFARSR